MPHLVARWPLRSGAAVVLVLALAARSQAQPAPSFPAPTVAHRTEAKQLVNAGSAAFHRKNYREAIELYRKAYAVIPHPILLFDIAQAQRLGGQLDDAARSYEGYLAADPNGAEAAAARALLASLGPPRRTARPAEQAPAAAVAEAALAPTPNETAPARALHSLPVATVLPAVERSAPTGPRAPVRSDAPGRPGRALRITGLAAGGLGLAGAGAALAFGLRVKAIEKEQITERYDRDLPYEADRLHAARMAERNQLIAAAIAAPLVVGGAVLYWAGHRRGRAVPTTAWVPMLGADRAGIAVTGALP